MKDIARITEQTSRWITWIMSDDKTNRGTDEIIC